MTSAVSRLASSRGDALLAGQSGDVPADGGQTLVEPGLVDVGDHHRDVQLAGEQQGQLAGHQTGADDADLGDLAGQRRVGGAGRPAGALLHQVERVDPGPELVRS